MLMIRLHHFLLLTTVLAAPCAFAQAQLAQPAAGVAGAPLARARVVLRATVTLSEPAVSLGQIADILTDDGELRQRLAALDLLELPLSGPPSVVSRSQISFRLQLAGFDPAQVRLEGPSFARVSLSPEERLEGRIEATARQALLEKIGGNAAHLSIQLAQRIAPPPFKDNPAEMQLEAEAFGRPIIPGRACVNVSIYVRNAQRGTVSACFDIRAIEQAPVALRAIAAGEQLSDKNVQFQQVPVDRPVKPGTKEQLLGHKARRTLPAGQVIAPDDVEMEPAAAPVIVIHQHDMVNILVRSGALQVTARGQAMEDGRVDQAIRVRNVDSNTVVTGRVVDRAVVEVELLRSQP